MSKPNWSNAPEWADWLAQDPNGGWFWFENKPLSGSDGKWRCMHGDCEEAESNSNWEETREQRP